MELSIHIVITEKFIIKKPAKIFMYFLGCKCKVNYTVKNIISG